MQKSRAKSRNRKYQKSRMQKQTANVASHGPSKGWVAAAISDSSKERATAAIPDSSKGWVTAAISDSSKGRVAAAIPDFSKGSVSVPKHTSPNGSVVMKKKVVDVTRKSRLSIIYRGTSQQDKALATLRKELYSLECEDDE